MPPSRAVAVVIRDNRVLVLKRHRDGVGYAVLPGGGVEPGESSAGAAQRELQEETTLTAEIDRLLWTGDHGGRPASYFLMKDVAGEPVLSASEAQANCSTNSFEPLWATVDDLNSLDLTGGHPRPGGRAAGSEGVSDLPEARDCSVLTPSPPHHAEACQPWAGRGAHRARRTSPPACRPC